MKNHAESLEQVLAREESANKELRLAKEQAEADLQNTNEAFESLEKMYNGKKLRSAQEQEKLAEAQTALEGEKRRLANEKQELMEELERLRKEVKSATLIAEMVKEEMKKSSEDLMSLQASFL